MPSASGEEVQSRPHRIRLSSIGSELLNPPRSDSIGLQIDAPAAALVDATGFGKNCAVGETTKSLELGAGWAAALKKSLTVGVSGGIAMMGQVIILMWLRTTISYQAVHRCGAIDAFNTLYEEGGIPRFYSGLPWALVVAGLSRFGDTAANGGVMHLTAHTGLPVVFRTLISSVCAAVWRVVILPIDTAKVMLALEGANGLASLSTRISNEGIGTLWSGAIWVCVAALGGHFPWFFTFNFLDERIPEARSRCQKNLRRGLIGFCAAAMATVCTNPFHNFKVRSQFHGANELSPLDAAMNGGAISTGLQLRIFSNLLSSILFTIMWQEVREIIESFRPRHKRSLSNPDYA